MHFYAIFLLLYLLCDVFNTICELCASLACLCPYFGKQVKF
uniref:Nodule Cysteine-Rich (NCR) secreted peptide n=1 Tax=Mesocestoides corti TaxID=53468 RepID=A0A5K3EFP1_MESCO